MKVSKVDKVLKIYGRSFDEVKKYIDGMAFMTSVNYNIGNDIPSALLKNLALTLGWEPNMSPITETNFLDSVYGTGGTRNYLGYSRPQTPAEVNFQFYRNLILNSGLEEVKVVKKIYSNQKLGLKVVKVKVKKGMNNIVLLHVILN